MSTYENYGQQSERINLSIDERDEIHKRHWKKAITKRAAKIKKKIDDENRFHAAMQDAIQECRSNADINRLSYLHYLVKLMFVL